MKITKQSSSSYLPAAMIHVSFVIFYSVLVQETRERLLHVASGI